MNTFLPTQRMESKLQESKKFAVLVLKCRNDFLVNELNVDAGFTIDSAINFLLSKHQLQKKEHRKLRGVVKTGSSRPHQRGDSFHFIYHAEVDCLPSTRDALRSQTAALSEFIWRQIQQRSLTYHELEIGAEGEAVIDTVGGSPCCVIIGSYRKHFAQMQEAIDSLSSSGIVVLSPKSAGKVVNPSDDFILLDYDPDILTEAELQSVVLKKMDRADFTYLVNPYGYLGMSAAFEIGYAVSEGIRIYSQEPVSEMHGQFIYQVAATSQISVNANGNLQVTPR